MGMILNVKNLSFFYQKKDKFIFKDLNLSIKSGEILCILGPNGIGKSTLLKCLVGINTPTSGIITFDNKDINSFNKVKIASSIAYVPQMKENAFDYSVFDYVLMGRAPYIGLFSSPNKEDKKATKEALEIMGIEDLSQKSYTKLSGGQQQLVTFARILAQNPKLLLLDEPTSHLDFGNQVQVLNMIKKLSKKGISIIMTSHFPDHAFLLADNVAILNKGSFLEYGKPKDVLTKKNLENLYNTKVKVSSLDDDTFICIPIL